MPVDALLRDTLAVLKYANGAYVILACALAGGLFLRRSKPWPVPAAAGIVGPVLLLAFCALALAYALYPNFFDHAEPAIPGMGLALLEGRPLYPDLREYTFHGTLYGPLAAETQAVAIALGTRLAGLPVMLSSKLTGIAAFLLATAIFFRMARSWGFARIYYLAFLLPFGTWAFWNRYEPDLLLSATAGIWAATALPRRQALLCIGVCAGIASAGKLHGCLYLAPPVVALMFRHGHLLEALLIPAAAAAAAFLLLFLPEGISLTGFIEYLLRGTQEGLSGKLFLLNVAYLFALWSPLAVVRWRALLEPELLALAAVQLVVTVIAAKPGAGAHHLLPFIPANALLFAARIGPLDARSPALALLWLAALLPGIASLADNALRMARDWRAYDLASRELLQMQAAYPGLVMGVGGGNFYPYAFLRPLLGLRGPPQVEYSSYMGLQYIGIPDTPLRQAFDSCRIARLAVPRREPPFSLRNYFEPHDPLFSDELRATFARRYTKIAQGTWFDTYECRR